MSGTEIPADLLDAYRATTFRVSTGGFYEELRIGQRSLFLEQLYAQTRTASALFITADNPFSSPASDADNRAAHLRLGAALKARSAFVSQGEGVADSGEWPAEQSYLALGIVRDSAAALGREFRQNAVVWAGADAVPELLLLR